MDSNIAHEMGLQGMKFKTHPLGIGTCASEYMFTKTHGKYTKEELDIKMTHVEPESALDRLALFAVKVTRFGFDQGECVLLRDGYILERLLTTFHIYQPPQPPDGTAVQSPPTKSSTEPSSLKP